MNKTTKQLLEENDLREKQLSLENQKLLTDIVAYLRSSSASTYQQELVHRDILDMLQEGEARGQTAREIIGVDFQAFCDEILAELPKRSMKQRIVYGLSIVSLTAAVLISIWLVFSLLGVSFQGRPFTLWLPVTAGQLLGGVVIIALAYGLVEYICRTSFGEQNRTRLQAISFLVCIFLIFLLRIFLQRPLFYLHAGIAAVLIAVLFVIYKVTDRLES